MLKKFSAVFLCMFFLIGLTVGCVQGPGDVVVDKSLKEKTLGNPDGKQASQHKGAAQLD